MNPRSINSLLNEENALKNWKIKAQQLESIEQCWGSLIPPLWRNLTLISDLEQGELIIRVRNNPILSKLKQQEPTLLKALHHQFPEIQTLKFKMSPQQPSIERPSKPNETLSHETLQLFKSLEKKIKPGRLAEAIQRLIKSRTPK